MRRSPAPIRLFLLVPYVLGLLTAAGCTTFSVECRTPVGDPALTPARAGQASPAVIGKRVTWGGTLIATRNLEQSTELEVLAMPLGRCGRPQPDKPPVGRFIIVRPGYLEGATLTPGREVTATGPITDIRDGMIGNASYRFPLLTDASPHVWPVPGPQDWGGLRRPVFSIGIGGGWGQGGWGWSGGGVGVQF